MCDKRLAPLNRGIGHHAISFDQRITREVHLCGHCPETGLGRLEVNVPAAHAVTAECL